MTPLYKAWTKEQLLSAYEAALFTFIQYNGKKDKTEYDKGMITQSRHQIDIWKEEIFRRMWQ